MKLSVRLTTLHSYYHGANSVWDIGCDHGQLGLSFETEALVDSINLVDPSEEVIFLLKNKIDSYITKGSKRYFIWKLKGQDVTLNSDKKIIFIAGMGGQEIRDILTSLLPQLSKEDRVVISPHRKILELRNYLSKSPYRLIDEQVVLEHNQFYQILCLSISTNLEKVSLYGDGLWGKGDGPGYLKHQREYLLKHQDLDSAAYFTYLQAL